MLRYLTSIALVGAVMLALAPAPATAELFGPCWKRPHAAGDARAGINLPRPPGAMQREPSQS